MKYIQRMVVALALFAPVLLGGAKALAQQAPAAADPRLQEMALGKADAPITIVEYASLTCPHCAAFHADVLPMVKKDYIDTGKVRFIFRDFPLDQLALAGAGLARCAGPERYFSFLDVLFAQQRAWATAPDPRAALNQIGRLGGLSAEQIDACFKDQAVADHILNSRLEGNQKFNVNSTPTIIINGKTEPGVTTVDAMRAKLEELLKGGASGKAGALPQPSGGGGVSMVSADTRTYAAIAAVIAIVGGVVFFFLRKR